MILTAFVLLLWFWKKPSGYGFYLLFAPAVMMSVQLIGVYLVFATLIFPALAAKNRSYPLLWGYGTGIVGFIAGIGAFFCTGLTGGAAVLLALGRHSHSCFFMS